MLKREIVRPPEHLFPPDEWRVIENRYQPEYGARAETVFALSNGYLGIRGTLDEGRPSSLPGTFVNGFHETWPIVHAEDAYGLAQMGQTIVNVPDTTVLQLYVDDEPLSLPTARARDYRRVLDMRQGTLRRDLLWSTPAGKHVRVTSCRLVSLEHRHVLGTCYEVTVDRPAPVVIASRVVQRDGLGAAAGSRPGRDPRRAYGRGFGALDRVVADADSGRIVLGYRTLRSGMALGLAVDHVIDADGTPVATTTLGPTSGEVLVTVDAEPGDTIRVVKLAAYQSSRTASPEEVSARCVRTLQRIRHAGFPVLLASQRANLDRFWERADVVVEARRNPVRLQQAVRWNLFQLAQATWRAEGSGVPAKGLTGDAYDGHYFWDTEAYVLPFLSYTQPRIARNLLRFRHSMLPKARDRAATLGLRGATFPWRTINGDEASANFEAGTAQYHLNADIAYAIRRYVDARADVDFLVEVGAEILVETARMWADLGFWGTDGRFHIHGVTGPDEYTTVVNDNAYTNLMARLNLNYAAATLRRLEVERPEAHAVLGLELRLDPSEPAAWERAAAHMYIPHDATTGITPQDDAFLDREVWDLVATPAEQFPLLLHFHPLALYRRQVLKQADVVMAMFLVGNEFSLAQKRRNFAYYDPLTTGDSSLSASVQSIVAAEIGEQASADRYFDFAMAMDLADVAGNASDGVHVASAAGTWMALVFGFGGVRDYDGRLTIDPRLPDRWDSLTFALRFHDRQIRVAITSQGERLALLEGDALEVTVRGEAHVLRAGHPLDLQRVPSGA